MNRKLWISSALAGAFALAAGLVLAQEPAPPTKVMMFQEGASVEASPLGPVIEVLGFQGMHERKVVTGAPFSGVAVSETTQTLADGNHITRKVQTNLFRDSQGRFRKEVSFTAMGMLAEAGKPRTFIVIHDPVANTGYLLEPGQKIARKTSYAGPQAKGIMKDKIESRLQRDLANGSIQKEDLGTQVVSGVTADGTRYTRTIPAGQIGNDKPISIVFEEWYSNDLQMVVKRTRSDPRFGTTTYTLTNIQRTEPDASLFQVPSDYTVKEGRAWQRGARRFKQAPSPPSMD